MAMKITTNPRLGISAYDNTPKTRAEIGSKAYKDKKNWALLNESKGEISLFGVKGVPTREQAYNYMRYRMPGLKQLKLSRMVSERIDLSAEAKLVYACLAAFKTHPRLYQAEIAGICGLSMRKVQLALYDLEQYGLIKRRKHYYSKNRAAPSTFVRLPMADRFTKEREKPSIFSRKADDLEERINEFFQL